MGPGGSQTSLFTMPIARLLPLGLVLLLGPDLFVSPVHALRCYSCSVTANSGDKRCISDPSAVEGQSVVNCNRKYCTIQRQEMLDPPDKINTFLRGCEEDPLFLNDVIEDPTFRTYYRSCSSDLCNSGDGLETSNGLSGLDAGASENLLVPGLIGSAPTLGGNLWRLSLFIPILTTLCRNLLSFS